MSDQWGCSDGVTVDPEPERTLDRLAAELERHIDAMRAVLGPHISEPVRDIAMPLIRFVARAVDSYGTPEQIEHNARLLMQPCRAIALLLEEAAATLRNDPDGLRRLAAARQTLQGTT